MAFSDFLLCEGIEPRKPLGKITKKKVVKNRGMVNQKSLDQIEFTTTDGNNVKVQFQIKDEDGKKTGDVVFYVNDTLDDRGGRKDGSVDPEIFGGVLWVVDVYSDRMGLDKLTFSAWSGAGDTKIVRGLNLEKPREVALNGLKAYRQEVGNYKAKVIPPTQRRIELAKKLGREPTVVYDVNVEHLQRIMGEITYDIEDRNVAAIMPFEEEVYKSRDTGEGGGGMFDFQTPTKLEDIIPGCMELLQTLKKYNVARMSQSEGGASVTRNRRQDLYKRLMDKFFSDKWSMTQKRDSFELTRKKSLKSAEGGMGESAPKLGPCLRNALDAIQKDPTLQLVKGPPGQEGDTAHFWTVRKNGKVYDPTPSAVPKGYAYKGRVVNPAQVRKELSESVIVERKSLEEKRVYIQSWTEEAMGGLRSGNYFACDNLKMPFGRFFGAKVVGKYDRERGIRNTYYIGTVDGDMGGSATGRADVEGNEGTVWVKAYGVYDALESILSGIDGFQEHMSRIEGFDAEGVIFAFSEGEKKVLYHELSHVYDLMMRGTKGVSGTEHRWTTRPEEVEAELNALYNAMTQDETLTLADFENSLTADSYGMGAADGRYDTMVGPIFGWARNHPEKVKISAQKIIRRWVDMRQMVMKKLSTVAESVERKPAASYSTETLMFAMFDESFKNYGQYYIPLLSKVIKKIFGDIQGYGWHLTSTANVERLKGIQGTNKSISTMHKKDIAPSVSGGGVASGAEVAVLVRGNVLLKYDINAWTVVDEAGNRWIPIVSHKTGKAIGGDIEALKHAYAMKLQELARELNLPDWQSVHQKYGQLGEDSKKKLLARFVAAMEEFILENAEFIKENIYAAIDVSEKAMDEVESGFNEIVISDFQIVKVVPVTAFTESRKFSDLMKEMPAWKDGDKNISKYMGDKTRQSVDTVKLMVYQRHDGRF